MEKMTQTRHSNVLNKQSNVTNRESAPQQKEGSVSVCGGFLLNVSHSAVLTELIYYVCNDLLMKRGPLASSSLCR